LRPGILDDLGSAAAVEWVSEEFQARTRNAGFSSRCRVADLAIDREHATALFRILQEMLTNVARHANATQVNLRLVKEEGSLILEVQDNGKGSVKMNFGGPIVGILGMRETGSLAGASLQAQRSSIRYNGDGPDSGGSSETVRREIMIEFQ